MEQRDRLIKELDSADLFLRNRATSLPTPLNEYDIEAMLDIAKICDETARILEKAIIPPCKVGDTAYHLTSIDTLDELNVAVIFEGKVCSISKEVEALWFFCRYDNGLNFWYTERDIGKTVFLTREEAEAELGRRKK